MSASVSHVTQVMAIHCNNPTARDAGRPRRRHGCTRASAVDHRRGIRVQAGRAAPFAVVRFLPRAAGFRLQPVWCAHVTLPLLSGFVGRRRQHQPFVCS
jgi:hypothetical protein